MANPDTNKSSFELEKYRGDTHEIFRKDFLLHLNNQDEFKFYFAEFDNKELLKQFVDAEFRKLTGRVYVSKSNDKRLILAVNSSDEDLKRYFNLDIDDKWKDFREIYCSSTNFVKVEFNELILT